MRQQQHPWNQQKRRTTSTTTCVVESDHGTRTRATTTTTTTATIISTRHSQLLILMIWMALLLQWPTTTLAFSNILLSTSGCYVELDTTEVIMNHMVEKAVPTAPLEIVLVESSLPDGVTVTDVVATIPDQNDDTTFQVVTVPSFPLTVNLQVLPKSDTAAATSPVGRYEFVLQIGEESQASFEHGSCTDQKRIAGQGSKTVVQLHVQEPNALVWGGWAAGHEAVKLLQGFQFVLAEKEEL